MSVTSESLQPIQSTRGFASEEEDEEEEGAVAEARKEEGRGVREYGLERTEGAVLDGMIADFVSRQICLARIDNRRSFYPENNNNNNNIRPRLTTGSATVNSTMSTKDEKKGNE